MSKQAGRMSQSANDFLEPKAPINVVATDVGTNRPYNNGAASVSFSLPGDSPAATSYTVTASTGQTATGASSPIVVTGLATGSGPTFTVRASNAAGTSGPSLASNAPTITTVPATMSAPGVSSPNPGAAANVAGAQYDTVTWSPQTLTGGKAVTGYVITGNDGSSATAGAGATSVNITQSGTQSYTIYATNANGSGTASASSSNVTTFAFTPYSFTPYSFTPYSFTPYSFTPFAFTPFAFTPYSFTPYSFTPYSFTPYSFTPYAFTPMYSFTPYSFTPYAFTPMYSFVPVYSFTPVYTFVPMYSFTPVAAGCRPPCSPPYFCAGSSCAY